MAEKTRERVKATGEVFTPRELIHEMLQKIPAEAWLPGKRWLEPSAGDGNFFYEVKHQLVVQAGIDERYVLDEMLFAIEYLPDNHFILQQRLGYLDEHGMPNREIWRTDEDLKKWFRIGKIDPDALMLNHLNPYYELGFCASDEIIFHRNMVCASALTYNMKFEREDDEKISKYDRRDYVKFKTGQCLEWSGEYENDMLTPCKGEQTIVDKFLQNTQLEKNDTNIEQLKSYRLSHVDHSRKSTELVKKPITRLDSRALGVLGEMEGGDQK